MLAGLPAASVDAVVCDPPYGIDFQHAAWDGRDIRAEHAMAPDAPGSAGRALEAWARGWGDACLRVLKPGGHLAAFGAPRTFHRVASGLEDAGLELRDTLMWLYGTGMPKSRRYPDGTGTGLKPAWEPIVLARKPLDGTGQANVDRHGTGRLNIDDSRDEEGRYPANVLTGHHPDCTETACVDGCPLPLIDQTAHQAGVPRTVSRLFYCPKASRKERDAGCDQLPARTLDLFPQRNRDHRVIKQARNPHPTVKPLAVMRWLVALVTPPDGLVVDPFCGSGTTGIAASVEGRRFVGIEAQDDYVQIARARIAHHDPEQSPDPATRTARARAAGPFVVAAKAARR